MDRPYVQDIPALERQIRLMEEEGVKAEIQCMESPTEYFKEKLTKGEWV